MAEQQCVVSVVVCALNEERTIVRQLVSLDAQVDAPPFEVLVVDNGSTDRTRDLVQQWIDADGHAASSMRLIDASSHPGIPAARNIGALAAKGRIVAFCDADDAVGQHWVAAFAKAVHSGALAGGQIIAIEPGGKKRPEVFSPGLIATRYLPHVANCNCAVVKETLIAVGGYDESLPAYGFEDVDLSWRIQEAGYPIIYVPEAVVYFSLGDARGSVGKRLLLGQGRVLMARRYPQYDPMIYTIRSTFWDAIRIWAALGVASVRSRSIDRQSAGQAVAAVGRITGAMKYPAWKPVPKPVLAARTRWSS